MKKIKAECKTTKKFKLAIAGTVVIIFSVIFAATAFADINYDSFPYEVIKHIVKATPHNALLKRGISSKRHTSHILVPQGALYQASKFFLSAR